MIYSYTKEKVSPDRLTREINDSAIITALDYITTLSSDLSVFFKAEISEQDKTTLDNIIAAHTGEPLNEVVTTEVITQEEKTDKNLNMARATGTITAGHGVVEIIVPGSMAAGDGRYVVGGVAYLSSFSADDYVTLSVVDKNRVFAWILALYINPAATEPLSDETVKAMGFISAFGRSFPAYPLVKTYTDDDMASENQGWFFEPYTAGSSVMGRLEIKQFGGYAFAPAQLALCVDIYRPTAQTGSVFINIVWGKIEE